MRILPLLFWSLTTLAWARPPIFDNLPFEEAQARARTEKKWLLVDSTATWCAPCQVMDSTTWLDEKVLAYCREHVVAIQVDVDEQPKVAKSLNIEAMPTLILFRDGQEKDRVVGLRRPAELLQWLEMVASGGHELDLLEKAALGGDLQAHLQWAEALLQAGQKEKATEQFVWLWDHMLEKDPAFFGVRHSFFQASLRQLLSQVPNARAPFRERLERDQVKVKAGSTDVSILADWVTLSELLDGGDSALDYALHVRGPARANLRPVEDSLFELLVERKRWREAGAMLSHPVEEARSALALEKELSSPDLPAGFARKSTQESLIKIYTAVRAAGKRKQAVQIRSLCLKHDSSAAVKQALLQIDKRFPVKEI